jgi:hypothetical protein
LADDEVRLGIAENLDSPFPQLGEAPGRFHHPTKNKLLFARRDEGAPAFPEPE